MGADSHASCDMIALCVHSHLHSSFYTGQLSQPETGARRERRVRSIPMHRDQQQWQPQSDSAPQTTLITRANAPSNAAKDDKDAPMLDEQDDQAPEERKGGCT